MTVTASAVSAQRINVGAPTPKNQAYIGLKTKHGYYWGWNKNFYSRYNHLWYTSFPSVPSVARSYVWAKWRWRGTRDWTPWKRVYVSHWWTVNIRFY